MRRKARFIEKSTCFRKCFFLVGRTDLGFAEGKMKVFINEKWSILRT